jgi:hypothetical protein
MAKKDYVDPNDNGFGLQQTTFKNSIGGYNVLLDVTAAEVTAQAADADYFNYTLACNDITQNDAKQWTAWKNLLRSGSSLPPGSPPVAPVLPTAIPAVLPGVETRFRALAKAIKTHVNYNDAIGRALGIEGVVITGPDLSVVQPIPTLNGGRVDIKWAGAATRLFSTCSRSKSTAPMAKASSCSPSTPRRTRRYHAIPGSGDEMELPRHLPCRRRARRHLERHRHHYGRRLKAKHRGNRNAAAGCDKRPAVLWFICLNLVYIRFVMTKPAPRGAHVTADV